MIETPILLMVFAAEAVDDHDDDDDDCVLRLQAAEPLAGSFGFLMRPCVVNLEKFARTKHCACADRRPDPPPLRSEFWKPHTFPMSLKSHACQCFVTSAYAREMAAAET